MSRLEVLKVPSKVLYDVSTPVEKIDNSIKKLMLDMLETMYLENGIGLAAPQVGVGKRVVVIDISLEDESKKSNPLFMVNPKIITRSKEIISFEEGCLSVPDESILINRHTSVSVEYLNYDGKPCKLDADGLLAICIQHEIDHLDGITILESCNLYK